MKIGDGRTKENMGLLFSVSQLASGEVKFKHVRCGWITFTLNQQSQMWIVTACERPDA